ncbi:MAG: beta-galactosidase [Capsulimonadaceae bacterium]|nr:beta-galactosidase [Capsulimonadaceae bacterium]
MRTLNVSTICVAIFVFAAIAGQGEPVPSPALFPFVANWDEASQDSAIDVSSLNVKPAGINGYIVAKNGHFVESKTGKRVRFLGITFGTMSNYPTHADAERVAVRLARMGINIVRVHHEDWRTPGHISEIWDKSAVGPARPGGDGLERLDYLIAQFKRQGIYVDLNLHTARAYFPEDGFPDSVSQIPTEFDKRVDNFDRRMIDLQKQFARDYLTHVNPYTKMTYAQDPCVAVMEINNEDSLVASEVGDVAFCDKLPEPFRGELVGQWNAWLKRRYASDDALRAAWTLGAWSGKDAVDDAALNKLSHKTWTLEDHTGSARLTNAGDQSPENAAAVQVDCVVMPAEAWQVQALIRDLDFQEGAEYMLSFRAKADTDRSLEVCATSDDPEHHDWHNIGLMRDLNVGSDWRGYRFLFPASQVLANRNRLSFIIGGATGAVWLSDVRLKRVTADDVASTLRGQSVEQATVEIPVDGVDASTADWRRFLMDTEGAYADEMRTYLRKDLKVHANIIDTQVEYGEQAGLAREGGSDLLDIHAYWQHPEFPGKHWDSSNWTIRNTPMTDALAKGEGNTLTWLTAYRLAGKPYTVSEYNHPAPSDYQAEMMPILSSYAALQDWDMIYPFAYGHYYTSTGPHDRIQDHFGLAQNTAKEAFFPSAALLFRQELISPLSFVAALHLPAGFPSGHRSVTGAWSDACGQHSPDLMSARFQTVLDRKVKSTTLVKTQAAHTEAGVRAITTASGSQYLAQGRAAIAATGYVGGQTVALGPASLTFPAFGNNFAALTLVSLDVKPLGISRRLLLTITGKAENLGMVWNSSRTSVGNHWGHGPVQAEGIPATVTLANASVRHVWALDPSGARAKEVPVTVSGGKASFTIGPEYRTVWYEIGE